jgi:hypothetical protein
LWPNPGPNRRVADGGRGRCRQWRRYDLSAKLTALEFTYVVMVEKYEVRGSQIMQWQTQLLDGAIGEFLSIFLPAGKPAWKWR